MDVAGQLVVMNHGSPPSAEERPYMTRPSFTAISSYFVARGYVVVLPLRRGYGTTGGRWAEGERAGWVHVWERVRDAVVWLCPACARKRGPNPAADHR